MSEAWWGFIGVIVGAVLTGAIEALRDWGTTRRDVKERSRKERADAYTQLLLAARRLRYIARGDLPADPDRIEEYKTDLSTAQYLIEMLGSEQVVNAGERVRRAVLDYMNERESRGSRADLKEQKLAARTAVDQFKAVARPDLA